MATTQAISGYPYAGVEMRDSQTALMLSALLGSGILAIPTSIPLDLTGAVGMPTVNHFEPTITQNNSSLTNAISIDTGMAWVGGMFAQNPSLVKLDVVPNSSGNTRRDLVVIRATWGAGGGIVLTTKQGLSDGSLTLPNWNTVPGSEYELPLAIIQIPNAASSINTMWDLRTYVSPQNPRAASITIAASASSWYDKANAEVSVPPVSPSGVGDDFYVNQGINLLSAGGSVNLTDGV